MRMCPEEIVGSIRRKEVKCWVKKKKKKALSNLLRAYDCMEEGLKNYWATQSFASVLGEWWDNSIVQPTGETLWGMPGIKNVFFSVEKLIFMPSFKVTQGCGTLLVGKQAQKSGSKLSSGAKHHQGESLWAVDQAAVSLSALPSLASIFCGNYYSA